MKALLRLSSADLNNLAIEAPDTPMHQGVLASLDGATLLDAAGHIRIGSIQAHVEARLERLPELRRVLLQPGPLRGRPVWIDDPDFRIENHVRSATLPPPGGESAALAFAEQEMALLMDRSRPLWAIWFLDGYGADRIALLIKLHHSLADGNAMVRLLSQIFDLEPVLPEHSQQRWVPGPAPSGLELFRDSLRSKAAALTRTIRWLTHPARGARSARATISAMSEAIRQAEGAPRTSLNRPIGRSRRIAALRIPLDDVKSVARAHGVRLNDVFLYLVASGLRRLLVARGELVDFPSIHASMAVSGRQPETTRSGNHAGTVFVPLPVDVVSPSSLLAAVARATRRAKAQQQPIVSTGLLVFLARLGITRMFIRRQHLINVLTTNLPGPPLPLYFAGGQVRDPIALTPIAGNVTVSFAALSYGGLLTLSLVADRAAWPDLDFLATAMEESWRALSYQAGRQIRAA